MMLSDDKTILVKVSNEDIRPDGSFDIPDSVTRIKSRAFFACDALKAITIPSNVTKIGAHAFKRCFGLQIIQLPATAIQIDNTAFFGCEGVHTVVIYGTDDNLKEQVIKQLSSRWGDKIISVEHAEDAFQFIKERLSSVERAPEINPLYLFLNKDASTTKRKNSAEQVEYGRLPDDMFHHINTFLGNDNIHYRRAGMLMYREPLPKNVGEIEAYKVKLENIVHHAIEEPLQLHARFRQQLKDILTSEKILRADGHIDAADAMHELFQKVYASYKANYSSNTIRFLKESSTAINETRTRLNDNNALNYPAAIVATFFGRGVVRFVDDGYKLITGTRHGFFQSINTESIDALEDGLESIAKVQPQ
ncbi:MAG: leucine-rich repeat domain-containing protein [Legionella sp.]|uniref:leucine-rich repeat domain-containing protein n=1 Tax=Legionella sp. TaxID=459 RepID=UPI00283C06C9|nr:leucine-rich repeat domain-containing protein [Legionella sp.]